MVVLPAPATTRAPSVERARIAASVTGSSGGASISTTASWDSFSSRRFIDNEPSSSLGLGGMRPAPKIASVGCGPYT